MFMMMAGAACTAQNIPIRWQQTVFEFILVEILGSGFLFIGDLTAEKDDICNSK